MLLAQHLRPSTFGQEAQQFQPGLPPKVYRYLERGDIGREDSPLTHVIPSGSAPIGRSPFRLASSCGHASGSTRPSVCCVEPDPSSQDSVTIPSGLDWRA